MRQSKKDLLSRIKFLEDLLELYKSRAVGTAALKQCKSNMCLDCKYAVVAEGRFHQTLFGCSKDCLCEDYDPVNLRTGDDNRND